MFKFYLQDAREDIMRNKGPSFATILLVFLFLTMSGILLLVQASVKNATDFLTSQAKIKIFVDDQISDANEIANALANKQFVKDISIETKADTVYKMKQLLQNRNYLLDVFLESNYPDMITIETADPSQIPLIAEQLKEMKGISDVIYAQGYVEQIVQLSQNFKKYGTGLMALLFLTSFFSIIMTINLMLYQNQKSIRIKLLLGAKPIHVRGQYLFEAWLLSTMGSILAGTSLYLFYSFILSSFKETWLEQLELPNLILLTSIVAIILGGSLMGVMGSYISTRRMIKHA
ncbi:cell division protein FtsX [Paenibacillus lentus]|uniref:cell division protein FtsX n=1 Tax=Paenibacillus lentus TaxID=1338368 RepID=UPI003657CC18